MEIYLNIACGVAAWAVATIISWAWTKSAGPKKTSDLLKSVVDTLDVRIVRSSTIKKMSQDIERRDVILSTLRKIHSKSFSQSDTILTGMSCDHKIFRGQDETEVQTPLIGRR